MRRGKSALSVGAEAKVGDTIGVTFSEERHPEFPRMGIRLRGTTVFFFTFVADSLHDEVGGKVAVERMIRQLLVVIDRWEWTREHSRRGYQLLGVKSLLAPALRDAPVMLPRWGTRADEGGSVA